MTLTYKFQLVSRTGPRRTHLLLLKRNPRMPWLYLFDWYDTPSTVAHPRMQPLFSGDIFFNDRRKYKLSVYNYGPIGTLTLTNPLESQQNSGVIETGIYPPGYTYFDAVFIGRSMS